MIDTAWRPRLAAKTKLKFDRRTARHVLLLPEKGLLLNHTASAVAALCTGEYSISAIVARLAEDYPDTTHAEIEQEVMAFLHALSDRGLLESCP